MADCTPQQQIDCGREFGRLAATLELVREDLGAVRTGLDEQGRQLADLRVSVAAQLAVTDAAPERSGNGRLAAAIAAIVGGVSAAAAVVWKAFEE